MVLKAVDLKVEDIVFGKLEDNSHVKSQKMAWISHVEMGNRLIVQTPDFLTETYGIPREGPFYQTVKSRAFYKLPFCHERKQHPEDIDYDSVARFYNKLQEIDKWCGSADFRIQVFGEKLAGKYEYQPLVRHPEEVEEMVSEEGAAPTNPYYRPPFTKVRLDLAYDSDKPTFKLYDKSSGTRKEVQLNAFDDVLQHMRFLTKHRMTIQFSKLYAMKTASGGEKRKYGIILKAVAVECANKTRSKREDRDLDPFSD
jgi:hypothetical protein